MGAVGVVWAIGVGESDLRTEIEVSLQSGPQPRFRYVVAVAGEDVHALGRGISPVKIPGEVVDFEKPVPF